MGSICLTKAGQRELMLLIETKATKEDTGKTQNIVKALRIDLAQHINLSDIYNTHHTAELTTQSFKI